LRRLGLGAACLPLLSRRARGAAPRRHLVIIQMSQGYRQLYWKPATGPLELLPSTVAPFEPFKQDLIFLPGLAIPGAGTSGRLAYGVMFYGLGATGAGTYKEPAGPTLDQVVGSALPGAGGRRSLNLGVMLDRPPVATTQPGGRYCFWTDAGQPIRPIGDPDALYRDLFAPGPDTNEVKRLMLRRKSILDYVGTDLDEYGKRVGQPEREVVDRHLEAIRELENQVQRAAQSCSAGAPPSPPLDLNADSSYPKIMDLHMKAMVAALRCGVTNVTTLQLSDADPRNVNLGAFIPGLPPGGIGYLSPTTTWRDVGRNPLLNGVDLKRIVDRWFMERLAGLLAQLREVGADGIPLLDDTVVLVGNHMEDGSSGAQRVPWMLAGKAGGTLDTGKCLASASQSIAAVMAAICEALGVTKHPYGVPLAGLTK